MNSRREVQRFEEVTWTREPGQDGRTYLAAFKVNGVTETFRAAVPLPDTIRATESDELGRSATEEDWEAAVQMKIIDWVSNGHLDSSWPPSQTILIPGIDYRELDTLFASAKGRGLIKA